MEKDLIRKQIIRKFGTISKCAEALGVTQPTLSALLKKPSYKLIERLKEIGVEIPRKYEFYIDQENQSIIKEPTGDYYDKILNLEIQIADIRKEVIQLKSDIYKLQKLIEVKDG